jgi:hypothetical protein
MSLKRKLLEIGFVKEWKKRQQIKKFKGSEEYWESRYRTSGNSGSGSYEHLAEFKAELINRFVAEQKITSVIEFGCGDGNQLTLAKYPKYIGLDVSPTAIKLCHGLFRTDTTKSFFLYSSTAFYDRARVFSADLTMSLDVLYHLVEKEIFENYLLHLFAASSRYVIIYASDFDQKEEPLYRHENRRNFTSFIASRLPEWKLKEVIKNKYPHSQYGEKGSDSDFFIYERSDVSLGTL